VPAWSILKTVEKLRDLAQEPTRMPHFGDNNILMQINKDGGHFGSTDNNTNLVQSGQQFAWLDFLMLNPSASTTVTRD
jgi:protease II